MLCNTDNTFRVSRYKPYKISKAFPFSFSKLHLIITRNVKQNYLMTFQFSLLSFSWVDKVLQKEAQLRILDSAKALINCDSPNQGN